MDRDRREFSFDTIDLKNDFMFCTVMRKAEYCKPFLEMLLRIPIRELRYAEKQMTMDIAADAKSIRLDVFAGDEAGTVYNIEMQVQSRENLPRRARYYQDMIDLNLLDKGHDYSELPNNIVIFVCDFDPFGRNRMVYSYENRMIEEPEVPLVDGTLKVFLNLRGRLAEVGDELRALVHYMNTGEATTEYTKSLDSEIRTVRSNVRWRREYMTLEEKFRDYFTDGRRAGMEVGLEEGRAVGRAEGLAVGRAEGLAQGRELIERIIQCLIAENRTEELPLVVKNFEKYLAEFDLT